MAKKPISVGVKAALITGCAVVIAAILGIAASLMKQSSTVSQSANNSPGAIQAGRDVIYNQYNLNTNKNNSTNAVTEEELIAFGERISKNISTLNQNKDTVNPLDGHLSGLSIDFVIRLEKQPKDRDSFLYDAGESIERNRFSVFLDPDQNLCCRVIDQNLNRLELKVSPALDTFDVGNVFYLICEYGSSENLSFLRILINGKQVAETHQEKPLITSEQIMSYNQFIGADLNGTNDGVFLLQLLAMSKRTTSLQEVIEKMKIFSDYRINPKTKLEGGVYFNGNGYGQIKPPQTK